MWGVSEQGKGPLAIAGSCASGFPAPAAHTLTRGTGEVDSSLIHQSRLKLGPLYLQKAAK